VIIDSKKIFLLVDEFHAKGQSDFIHSLEACPNLQLAYLENII
jgi:hypothetical protein